LVFIQVDRDNRWERVKKGFSAIYNAEPKTNQTPENYIKESYQKGVTDEFIEPAAFKEFEGINDGDGVIIANFRSDRVREITTALADSNFDKFERDFKKINIVQ